MHEVWYRVPRHACGTTRRIMRLVRNFSIGACALAFFALMPAAASAETYTFDSCISSNWSGCSTLPSQLKVEVTDAGSGYVDFKFTNNIGIESSITAIYFDADGLFTGITVSDYTDGVAFEAGDPTPPDVPSATGATPPFQVTTLGGKSKNRVTLGADSAGSPEGLDDPGESVTLRLKLADGVTFTDIINALDDGTHVDSLRIAAHIQGLPGGFSDSVICCGSKLTPGGQSSTPEPATMSLFGLMALGAAYRLRRR